MQSVLFYHMQSEGPFNTNHNPAKISTILSQVRWRSTCIFIYRKGEGGALDHQFGKSKSIEAMAIKLGGCIARPSKNVPFEMMASHGIRVTSLFPESRHLGFLHFSTNINATSKTTNMEKPPTSTQVTKPKERVLKCNEM